MSILVSSLVVFSITLVLTKSKILACKRKFVENRYQDSKRNKHLSFTHRWWRAVWTCPMCSGFSVAVIVCYFTSDGWFIYILDVATAFGLNWLLHCIENALFQCGKYFEHKNELD